MAEKYPSNNCLSSGSVCEIRYGFTALYKVDELFITNRNALATKGLWSRRERVQRLIIQCVNSPCVGNSVEVADGG